MNTLNKNIEKINEKDKKIITYLHNDLEISKKQLAKECNISEQSLNYKIQRLEDLNILTPLSLFNFRPLGFRHYNILISKISSKDLENLQKSDEITVLIEIFGNKRYLLEVITKDIELFSETYLQNCIFDLVELRKDYINNQNLFDLKLNPKLINKFEYAESEIDLNKESELLIKELSINPKHSILSLSQKTNFHRQTVQKYLKKLKENSVLYKRIYGINGFTLGFNDYILHINFQQQDKKKLISTLKSQKYISIFSTSIQEMVCYCATPNFRELSKMIQKIEERSENVEIQYYELLDILKIENIPKKLF